MLLTAVLSGGAAATQSPTDDTTDDAGIAESSANVPATPTLTAIPEVRGPIAETSDSLMWSGMERARVPFDVADHGYVEEEYFLSGTANVYDDADGIEITREEVPYVNNILVRRPADPADASGVVLVDILNASNGFPGEDHWRRMWDWAMEEGHTVIGLTSKPIQVNALQNYDPERYADLSWVTDPSVDPGPIVADPEDPGSFDPFMLVEGSEEGLVWDITTQLGVLLASDEAGTILGGQTPETTLLLGQSQSGVYLNTYTSAFHEAQAEANGGSVWDGYLNSVGAVLERPLSQSDEGGFVTVPGAEPGFDVPFITVSSEGDAGLFGAATLAETELPENRFHWQVPGTPHTDLLSTVIPADEEIHQAGRVPNTQVHDADFRDALNLYPLEPAIIAAAEALVDADQDGTAPAQSRWFDQTEAELVRDGDGNATGGVRYGLIEHPLGTYAGAASPGAVYGSMDLISAEEFAARYGTRDAYLEIVSSVDAELIEAGYLTEYGAEYFLDVAEQLLDRIGVTDEPEEPEPTPPSAGRGFYLNNGWDANAEHEFSFGRVGDDVLVGDWDGDGQDTLGVRRGNAYFLTNSLFGGDADVELTYGRAGDTVLVGDWDGDSVDTFAVRRGNGYFLSNSHESGWAETELDYGRANDQVLVGDYDGDEVDTFAVRRGNTYFVSNTLESGWADAEFDYGRSGDEVLVGDWDGDGNDTFASRRGNLYLMSNALEGGWAEIEQNYGRSGDEVFVGDWDGDGSDTLGVRR
ncbi:alpha/beta hydrolase domain-containing protein [Georgenia sp. Z1344]|uniref:alpha/beta hydrolase domain-containing protein n=1 Tax=Georgenia sp. Z1344 TaxID=3416706 RepID=UPI003CE7CD8F